MNRKLFVAACTLAGLAVALGAFGAHAWQAILVDKAGAWFQTANQYHMMHALALLAIAVAAGARPNLRLGAWVMLAGTLLFSGSLYILALSGIKQWAMLTPVGGGLLLISWGMLAVAAFRGAS